MWWLETLAVLVFAMGWWPCCCTEVICDECEGGAGPDEFQVILSVIVDDACTGAASVLNGTWILTHVEGCVWLYTLPFPAGFPIIVDRFGTCTSTNVACEIRLSLTRHVVSPLRRLSVRVLATIGGTNDNFSDFVLGDDVADPRDCSAFVNTDVPWSADGHVDSFITSISWDASGATCEVTSL